MVGVRGRLVAAVIALGLAAAPVAGATPSNPLLSGSVSGANGSSSLSGATSVAVSGTHAYTTAYSAGELTAVDFSNPARPFISGSSTASNSVLNDSTVNIVGGFAYVVSKNRNGTNGSGINDDGTGNTLSIFDISTNPAVPTFVGSVTDTTKLFGAYGVAVSGNYAYIAAQGCITTQPCPNGSAAGNSFEVVDISNPMMPTIKASLADAALPGLWAGSHALQHACSVTISGHYAYVTAAYSNRLTIVDISNPLAPVIVSSLQDASNLDFPVDVAVQGNYAYVADQATPLGRMAVVDVSNPTSPHVAASVTDLATMNGAYRIRVRGNFAYVSGSSVATVAAIDISDPLHPREVGHVTDTAHLNKTTGLDVDPTGDYVVASSPYLSTQSNPVYPPFIPAPGAAPVTGSISVILLNPQAPFNTAFPSISGTAMQGDQLTASTGTWAGVPAPSFAYQWSDCDSLGTHCSAISGATSATYAAAAKDVGSRLEVTVTATNLVGSSRAESAPTSAVAPRPGPPPSSAPAITSLRQSAKTWRTGAKLAHITAGAAKRGRKRPPVGTSFSFTLNESASVNFSFSQQLSGRKVNGSCRRLSAQNRGRRHCKLSAAAGKLVFAAHQGANKVSFAGRISHSRKLGPGRYVLAVTATAAGKRSKTRTIAFTIAS